MDNIRTAKPNEKETIIKLWEYCFDDSSDFVQWFFNTRYQHENTLVVCDKDRICSALQLLPYNISIRSKKMETSYIVGVSTWPEDRGKGYVSELLYKSLAEMRKRKQWVSILLPFNYNFYKKYGWETCYSYYSYSGQKNNFLHYLDRIGIQGKIRPIRLPEDLEDLNKYYSYYTKGLNGYVIRNKQDWDRILSDVRIDGGNGFIYTKDNKTAGYMILVNDKEGLSIRKICCKDIDTYMEMLKIALNFSTENNMVFLQHKLGLSPLPHIIELDVIKQEKPFVMGRIVDVEKALENLPISYNDELVIQVIDPLLEWNNIRLNLKGRENRLLVSPTQKSPDIVIHISVLSQLLWGYYTVEQAFMYKKIQIYNKDKVKALENIFYDTIPYIYEDY
ncbi:MAG: GNAT family N-acetyltransferase [Clostridiales bacterium]|nr:GNAT family N-acetyltransferase [Clostridiales bacterium]